MLIEHTWTKPAFEPISLSPCMSEQAQADIVVKTLELYNNEPSGIGRLWNEMWNLHHVSISWEFGHFFNNLSVFTMEDIMKIQPVNFVTAVKSTV